MKKIFVNSVFIGLLGLLSAPLMSQVRVHAFAEKDKILLGEQFKLTVEAYAPLGQPVRWNENISMQHFEVLHRSKIDTAQSIETNKYVQTITLTSFDSGRWQIPQLEFLVGGQPYYTDTIGVDVVYTSFDPSEDYHDIKEIEEIRHPFAGYIPYIVLAAGILSLGGVIYLLAIRKRPKPVAPPPPPIVHRVSPYDEAMSAMAALKEQSLDEKDQVKEYYTALNDILRQFLHKRLNIQTLEKTNGEILVQLRSRNMPETTWIKLVEALQMSDYVKFARHKPGRQDNEDNFETIRNTIELLNRSF